MVKLNKNFKKVISEMTVRSVSYLRWPSVVSEALETLRQATNDIDNFFIQFFVSFSPKNKETIETRNLSIHEIKDVWSIIENLNTTSWLVLYKNLNSYLKTSSTYTIDYNRDGELVELKISNSGKVYISACFRTCQVDVAIAEDLSKIINTSITDDLPVIKSKVDEEYFDYDKQKMVYEPSDILHLLNSYLEVVSEQDAKSFFDDMDRYLKGCRKVKSDFRKSKAMKAWKLAEKESASFNDNDDLDTVMETGLKYTELPTPLLEIGNYFDGNFEPYIGFFFKF